MTTLPACKAGNIFSCICKRRAAAKSINSVLESISVFFGSRIIWRISSATRTPPGSRVGTISRFIFWISGKISFKTVVFPAPSGPSREIRIPFIASIIPKKQIFYLFSKNNRVSFCVILLKIV